MKSQSSGSLRTFPTEYPRPPDDSFTKLKDDPMGSPCVRELKVLQISCACFVSTSLFIVASILASFGRSLYCQPFCHNVISSGFSWRYEMVASLSISGRIKTAAANKYP